MELINCHIENFGKFHKQDFEFKTGLNSFLYENGWGKTTLSIFIKTMFYGMEYTSSKDINKNEKLNYLPWQNGEYGGSLVFAHKNKIYKITRYFGMKKNEDTFTLHDMKTNKPIDDYSENIGTELYGINRETYGRSVHVALDESPVGSADISAKLNNLIEAGDIGDFDQAYKALDDKATVLKAKKGGNGAIAKISQQIDDDRDYLTIIVGEINQNEEYLGKISKLKENIEILSAQQKEVTSQIAANAKFESKIRYDQLINDVKVLKERKESIDQFFNDHIPTESALQAIDSDLKTYSTSEEISKNKLLTQADKNNYEELKTFFKGDKPTIDQINSCIKADIDYKLFKQNEGTKKLTPEELQKFSVLKSKYDGMDITEEKINGFVNMITDVQTTNIEIPSLETAKQKNENDLRFDRLQTKTSKKTITLFILTVILIVSGITSVFLLNNFIFGAIGIVLGFFSCMGALFFKTKPRDFSEKENEIATIHVRIDQMKSENAKKEREYKNFILSVYPDILPDASALSKMAIEYNSYASLCKKEKDYKEWLSEQPIKIEDFEAQLKSFAKRYCNTDDILSITSEIQNLNGKLSKLDAIEKQVNENATNDQIHSKIQEKLSTILSQYQTEKALNYPHQVQQIHDRLNDLKNIITAIEEAENKVKCFEADPKNDFTSFDSLRKPDKSVDELNFVLETLTDKINEFNKEVSDYQKVIDKNLANTEKKDDTETEIDRLTIEKKEKELEYSILTTTRALLTAAKEKLNANYSDPMKIGFAKYLTMIGGNAKFIIDTDLKVSIDESGKMYDSEFLSEGYKDMVNFCSRMALVDALFTDVQPPVILDDPFVNLDDNKVPRALQVVKNMANDKQVFYFACHKSREV